MPISFERLKNNKNVSIVLAFAAVAVWTKIALHITEFPRVTKGQTTNVENVYNKTVKDSIVFTLSLDYEDPFHGSSTSTSVNFSTPQPKDSVKIAPPKLSDASDLSYLGSVVNASGKRKGLVRYRSTYYYADVRDTIGSFRVKRIDTDSILLTSPDRRITIVKRSQR